MKKSVTLILLALSLIFLFTSCGETDVPDGMQYASSENEAFKLFVPSGWTVNTSGGIASAFYNGTDTSNVSMTSMMSDGIMTTLEDYQNKIDSSLSELFSTYEKVSDFADTTLGGKAAKTFDYICVLDGVQYKYRQVFCYYSSYYYVFTYTSSAEKFDSHLEDVETILSEVVFK